MKILTIDDLHAYQKRVIIDGINLKQAGLLLGTGLGKTVITLTIIDQLLKRGLINNALVLSTKRVIYNTWKQEAQQWEHLQYLKFSIVHGDAGVGTAEMVKRRNLAAPAHVYLLNYEGIPWFVKTCNEYFGKGKMPIQFVAYDESTKMKHTTTQRFKRFKKYMNQFAYRYILTGTPIPNGIQDIFGQMYLIDGGKSLGTTITGFRQRYLDGHVVQNRFTKYTEKEGAREQIQRRIKHRIIYLKKEEHVQLPPITHNAIEIDMPDTLRAKYEQLEREFFLELEDSEIEVFNSSSLAAKLRQFLQGRMYDENHTAQYVHEEKLRILEELLEGMGNTLIAYNFHFERDDLRRITGNNTFAIDGRTRESDANLAIKEWNKGRIQHLLCNPAGVSHGLNLQHGGSNIVWYSLTYNLEHYEQFIDRIYRQGQKDRVVVHHILFRNTIDMVIFKTLRDKDATQKSLLNALKSYKNDRELAA